MITAGAILMVGGILTLAFVDPPAGWRLGLPLVLVGFVLVWVGVLA